MDLSLSLILAARAADQLDTLRQLWWNTFVFLHGYLVDQVLDIWLSDGDDFLGMLSVEWLVYAFRLFLFLCILKWNLRVD